MNSCIYQPSDTAQVYNLYYHRGVIKEFPQTASSLAMRVEPYVDREYNKMQENIKKLVEFSTFENNWNGYNAVKFTPTVIKKVEDIIKRLHHQPNIFPTGSDSIQLEYYKDENNYLEIEISDLQTTTLFYSINGKDKEQDIDDKDIVMKLDSLYKYYVK